MSSHMRITLNLSPEETSELKLKVYTNSLLIGRGGGASDTHKFEESIP